MMKAAKRAQTIIELLETRGEMSVSELSELLGISPANLRKQLAVMQANGQVIRTYGGVMPVNRVPDESFESKLHKSVAEKRRIAEQARKLISGGCSIALGSGTTVFALSSLLENLPQTVVYTNSVRTADNLARCASLEVHVCCGILRSHTQTIIGSEAMEYFRTLKNVDIAFIGCDAIDHDGNVLSDNLSVAAVEKLVLLSAKRRYVLCDASKFGKKAVAHIASLKDCDGLITCQPGFGAVDVYATLTEILYA